MCTKCRGSVQLRDGRCSRIPARCPDLAHQGAARAGKRLAGCQGSKQQGEDYDLVDQSNLLSAIRTSKTTRPTSAAGN